MYISVKGCKHELLIGFSKTGKRRGAIKEALDDTQEEREQLIQEVLSKAIKVTFEQIFKNGNN